MFHLFQVHRVPGNDTNEAREEFATAGRSIDPHYPKMKTTAKWLVFPFLFFFQVKKRKYKTSNVTIDVTMTSLARQNLPTDKISKDNSTS